MLHLDDGRGNTAAPWHTMNALLDTTCGTAVTQCRIICFDEMPCLSVECLVGVLRLGDATCVAVQHNCRCAAIVSMTGHIYCEAAEMLNMPWSAHQASLARCQLCAALLRFITHLHACNSSCTVIFELE